MGHKGNRESMKMTLGLWGHVGVRGSFRYPTNLMSRIQRSWGHIGHNRGVGVMGVTGVMEINDSALLTHITLDPNLQLCQELNYTYKLKSIYDIVNDAKIIVMNYNLQVILEHNTDIKIDISIKRRNVKIVRSSFCHIGIS